MFDPQLDLLFVLKASSSTSASRAILIDNFVGMGFSAKLVSKAIEENGRDTSIY